VTVSYCVDLMTRAMWQNPDISHKLVSIELYWDEELAWIEGYNMNTQQRKVMLLLEGQNNEDAVCDLVVALARSGVLARVES
jgi:hypothetical protein